MSCVECHHVESCHISSICNGSITCLCPKFIPAILVEFAQEVEMQKDKLKSVYCRCKYILERIPPSRNAGEKTFAKIYREIWYGFKIRKEGTTLNTEEWNRLPNQDTINREKRRVKQKFPQFATYDKEILLEQTAIFQALVEMAIEA